jgi:DNA-binding winged helix-turn-helix (wHTH) protein
VERPAQSLQFGAVTLHVGERLVLKDGRPVSLTPKAFDLLCVLAAHPGRLLTKDELILAVWPDTTVEESNLAYNVFAIRKALGDSADGERYIETVPKRGYRFVAAVTELTVDTQPTQAGDSPDLESQTSASQPNDRPSSGVSTGAEPVVVTASRRTSARSWLMITAGVVLGIAVAVALGQFRAVPTPRPEPFQFQEPTWSGAGLTSVTGSWPPVRSPMYISPDGRRLASSIAGEDGVMRIWVRSMNAPSPKPLFGTETLHPVPLFWSPDSTAIAFDATGAGALKAVNVTGGAPQRLCDFAEAAVGGSWNREGIVIVGTPASGIMQCRAGGLPTAVTRANAADGEMHLAPSFLADGRHFIYLRISRTQPELSGIYLTALDSQSADGGRRLLTTGFAAAHVGNVPGEMGLIVFGRDGDLFAQRFDERRLEMTGEPVQLAARIDSFLDYAYFAASASTLVYKAPEPAAQLIWFDREGRELSRVGAPEHVVGLALSPNGDRALVAKHAPKNTVDQDLWVHDLIPGANPRRMTLAPTLEFFPVWATNARFVYASGGGETGIYAQTVGQERELVFDSGHWDIPTSVSGEEGVTLFTTFRDPALRNDVWIRSAASTARDGAPLISRQFDQGQARLSPNQRWVAYVSNETGTNEVYVAPFGFGPTGEAKVGDGAPISKGGGFAPRWRGDGQELFYLKIDGSVMAASGPEFAHGRTTRLFVVSGVIPEWGVTNDGRRFLFAVPVSPTPPFTVVRDWQASLK